MEKNLSSINRVYKTNMTDILDLPVLIKRNASKRYFRELEARARAKGIIHGKGGVDKDNGVWFEVMLNGKRYRYTFCYQFSTHSLDSLAVDQ